MWSFLYLTGIFCLSTVVTWIVLESNSTSTNYDTRSSNKPYYNSQGDFVGRASGTHNLNGKKL
jgi:hypothetical protein